MKLIHLHCRKCPTLLSTFAEVKRGLCDNCYEKAIRTLSQNFSEGARSSLMDDFINSVDLEK